MMRFMKIALTASLLWFGCAVSANAQQHAADSTVADGASLIVTALPNPNEMAAVQAYFDGVLPLLLGADGVLVKRLNVQSVIHGRPSGVVLVMDFPSAEAIESVFASDSYGKMIRVRERAFLEINILITSDM